jgi:excisionase family DNA binding protein
MEKHDKLLSVAEVGAQLGVVRQRVLQLIWGGLLEAERVGRSYVIRESDVRAYKSKGRPKLGRPPKASKNGHKK